MAKGADKGTSRGGTSRSLLTTASLLKTSKLLGEKHRLVVWTNGQARSWPLPPSGAVTIGRDAKADVRIDSAAVSRRHARIHTKGRLVAIEDLQSRNGTRVNGERVSDEHALGYGDVITMGDVITVLEEQDGQTPDTHADDELPPDGIVLEIGERTLLVADPVMLHVYTQLERLAQTPLSVLIVGETGTGKDLAANALHSWSKRRDRPMVSVNCSALPETLAESELFGYERGAFSGANRDKVGLLESASEGTVFLDEIGDLPPMVQPKLLRVLESRKVMRLGSVKEHQVDVRIVAATHRDLAADVRGGRFRQDLFYRLSAAVVQLPPLRARRRELRLLAERFLSDASLGASRPRLSLSEGAVARLQAHDWPGNVRELKNLMEYLAATISEGPVTPEQMPAFSPGSKSAASASRMEAAAAAEGTKPFRTAKEDFERSNIENALVAAGGNRTRAAKILGMPLRTLTWKLKRFGM